MWALKLFPLSSVATDDKGGHGLKSEKKWDQLIQGLMLWLHTLTKNIRDLKQQRQPQQQCQKTILVS